MLRISHHSAVPHEPEIRAALDRICASRPFAASRRLKSFLRFVVQRALEGRGHRLKGYTIGVEALGRPPDFDPQIDPIVRVEATRLRRALARYYSGEGALDPIVIDLPLGRYTPTFRRLDARAGAAMVLRRAWQALLRVLHAWLVLQPPSGQR
jgi:hypothetical protein